MTLTLTCLFTLTLILPQDSLALPQPCATVNLYGEDIFCAPFTGSSVYRITTDRIVHPLPFTDAPVRIKGFTVTPFALFINDGTAITRYFPSTMNHSVMIQSKDISSFVVTESEEIIYADQRSRTVCFLDYTGQEKNRIEDILVRDMAIADNLIYVLTSSAVVVYDEFGNARSQLLHHGTFNRLHVQGEGVFLYSQGTRILSVINDRSISSYDLPHSIQDIAGSDTLIHVLDNRGTFLSLYTRTDL